ncbi:MAG TPA: hypothetical protein ENI86_17675 [Acidimicrobiales bacterium]|nr:hypothetical protein [Acidimicrobiales bacterium]
MQFPDKTAMAETFEMMLGKEVDIVEVPHGVVKDRHPKTTYVYLNDSDEPTILVEADLSLAHAAGAAMALIPPSRASDATEAGEPDVELLANFKEVINILSALLNDRNDVHVRLDPHETEMTGPPPTDLQAVFEIEIDRYDSGRIGFGAY